MSLDHGKISKNIAKGLRELRKRIARAKVPATVIDKNITIATWNIREFGRKRRRKDAIHYIAEVLSNFDLTAVVEVRDNLSDLRRVMDLLGPDWSVVFSDFATDRAGNRERVAYVFDTRAVQFTGLAAEADEPRRKRKGQYLPTITWWRSPFIGSFRAGTFDFILITAHVRWGSGAAARIAPLQAMADWVSKRSRERYVLDKDIILLGDFNIPSRRHATFKALTSRGLRVPKGLLKKDPGTNLVRNKRYDQILHYPRYVKSFTDEGGVVDFYGGGWSKLFIGAGLNKTQGTYQLSDHLPLWAQLDVDLADERLDQVLSGG